MRKTLVLAVVGMAMTLATVLPMAGMAGATETGTTEGCTPGFWKNHTNWTELTGEPITTSTTFANVGLATLPLGYSSKTLFEALSFQGGPGFEGGLKILLRATASGYLNAAAEIEYPFRRDQLETWVEAAVASGQRSELISLASRIDTENNLGCPF